MSDRRGVPHLGITVGDPAGIGPEVVSASLRSLNPGPNAFRVYGNIAAVERAGGLPEHVEVRDTASADASPGEPNPKAVPGVIEAIRRAARDCLSGSLDAMVTGPISKRATPTDRRGGCGKRFRPRCDAARGRLAAGRSRDGSLPTP